MSERIPFSKDIPDFFWNNWRNEISRWDFKNPVSNKIWNDAEIGHPYAGSPEFDLMMEPADALPLIQNFVKSRPDVPELTGVLLSTQFKGGFTIDTSNIGKILGEESWKISLEI